MVAVEGAVEAESELEPSAGVAPGSKADPWIEEARASARAMADSDRTEAVACEGCADPAVPADTFTEPCTVSPTAFDLDVLALDVVDPLDDLATWANEHTCTTQGGVWVGGQWIVSASRGGFGLDADKH